MWFTPKHSDAAPVLGKSNMTSTQKINWNRNHSRLLKQAGVVHDRKQKQRKIKIFYLEEVGPKYRSIKSTKTRWSSARYKDNQNC